MADRRTLLGCGLAFAGALPVLFWPRAVGHGWIAALFFWSAVPVGSIAFLLIMRLVGGGWRGALGPAMVAGTRSLPVAALATSPLLPVIAALYPWVDLPQPGLRGAWLAPLPFALRSLLWFAGLAAILFGFARSEGGRRVAIAGLLFLVPMGSLVAVDWLMSLDPDFHSSGFGLQALVVQFTIALMLAVVRRTADRDWTDPAGITGALMLTLLMLWGYFAYLPFFIIWSGNVPAGAAWYLARAGGGWGLVASVAVGLHIIPLLLLLSPVARRSPAMLRALALAVLVGDAAQAAWLVLPTDGPLQLLPVAAFLAAMALLGGATRLAGGAR